MYANAKTRILRYFFDLIENSGKEPVDMSELTIEHIMPETLSTQWKTSLGDNYQEIYDKYVHTLGNLSITGYNSEYSNDPFLSKKKRYNDMLITGETKIIKLPEILMFTLERNQGSTNNVEIMPNEIIDMSRFVDESLKYTNTSTVFELFAISIIFGTTQNNRHEICQVKRNGQWYEINDTIVKKINSTSYFDRSYGLFYKKKVNIK
jgi:hypothetical protein